MIAIDRMIAKYPKMHTSAQIQAEIDRLADATGPVALAREGLVRVLAQRAVPQPRVG